MKPIEVSRPLIRMIEEGFTGKTCDKCGSSVRLKFIFFGKEIGCIQPECDNYIKKKH